MNAEQDVKLTISLYLGQGPQRTVSDEEFDWNRKVPNASNMPNCRALNEEYVFKGKIAVGTAEEIKYKPITSNHAN